MRDPKLETPIDLAKKLNALNHAAKNYKNPRNLPDKWLEAYLTREPELLALDVMRSYDEIVDLKDTIKWVGVKFWIAVCAASCGFAISLVMLAALLGKI